MTISLLCVLCGGETAVDMADFASAKEDFLREVLELPHGPPCHDTFSRLFGLITPVSFQQLFDKFRADFAPERDARSAIAIDGKEMRRAFDRTADKSGLRPLLGQLGAVCLAGEFRKSFGKCTIPESIRSAISPRYSPFQRQPSIGH